MTPIAALSVPTITVAHGRRSAAPLAAAIEAEVRTVAKALAPETRAFAATALHVLIEAQAQALARREDPQPAHGGDDQHGHQAADPPPVVAPPVVAPPVVAPPVITPPVESPPPVVAPPTPTPPPRPRPNLVDPSAAARATAILTRSLLEDAAIRDAGAAFTVAAAERAAFRATTENTAAISLLQAFRTYDLTV